MTVLETHKRFPAPPSLLASLQLYHLKQNVALHKGWRNVKSETSQSHGAAAAL